MDKVSSYTANDHDTIAALASLAEQLQSPGSGNGLVFTFYGCDHNGILIDAFLQENFAGKAIIGGSSSGGLMTESGFYDEDTVGLLVLEDQAGEYGVADGVFDDDPEKLAEKVLMQALDNCNCTGQLPELIWLYQTPGHEEAVMRGLRNIIGDHCPIMGGTAADNDVSGQWHLLGPSGALTDGLVIAVMFPSSPIGFAFQGGYEPSGPQGTVTGIGYHSAGESGVVTDGVGRDVLTIDGAPAAEVYNRWANNAIASKLDGGSILAETTMYPIAINTGDIDGVGQYLLIHPESVLPQGGLRTFRELETGMRIHAMRGDRQQLVARAGRVADHAKRNLELEHKNISGAIMIYCGGCKLAVGDDITEVARTVGLTLGGTPFIGCFTFGEQGYLLDKNVHGNLMISAVVFGK